MRKVTSDFKNQIERDNRNYYEWVDITLKDGTVLNLTNKNIWNSGIKIEDAVSDTSEFQIGTAIINKATVTLNNLYDDFTDYDFDEAKIVIYIGYNIDNTILYRVLQDTTGKNILDSTGNEIVTIVNGSIVEKVKMFTGTVVNSPYQNSSLITLTCEDNMLLFDRDYSESKLIYPATRAQILRDACERCGVSLETLTFKNSGYIVNTRPSDEKLTFRQVIAWTAQLGGQFLRCNSDGKLFCGWYDLKNYEVDTVNEEYFDVIASNSSVTVNSEDVIITGIQVTAYQENQSEEEAADTSLYGKTGYVIAIADNKLIEKGTASTVAAMIGEQVTGMRFRPFSASTLNNPTYEAGDICIIKDRKGVSYKSFITSSTFQVGKYHTVQCGAKSAAKNSSKQYSVFSQAQVENRKNFQREKTEREKAVEEFNKALDSASGMYPTEVKQEDGSTILYVHDKKTLEDSKNVFKITSDAVGFSTDGGKTYPFGFTIDGDFLTRILYAIGINADYINTGTFTVKDADGNITFQADTETGRVIINANTFQVEGKTVTEIVEDKTSELETNFSKFQETVKGAFRDGIISESEAQVIERSLLEIEKDNESVTKQYNALIDSVSRKSAETGNNFSIKFNENCKTEISSSNGQKYDNLSLYYQKDGKIYKALDAVSGADIAGNTYIVPSTDIYIQWYSDSTNCNYYGFSIDSITRTNTAATTKGEETSLPNYEVIEATIPSMIQTSHPYENSMKKLWHYKARIITRTVLELRMSTYTNTYTSLKNAINSAISDRTITDAEKKNVSDKVASYNSALASLKEGLAAASLDVAAIAAAAATDYARAAIKVEADKIILKVSKSDVESIIEQKADSIRLKASKISWTSDYSSMTEDGTLTCQNANIMGTLYSRNGKMKTYLRNGSLCLIYNDNDIGMIGTNEISGYSGRYGLNFDLDYTGEYMAWAAQTSSTSLYALRWTFARNSIANLTGGALNAGCDIDMHNWTLKNPSFEGGGINGTINFTHILNMNSDGSCRYSNGCHMQFKNGILVSGSWSNG
jgi:hypothetical protein